MVHILLNSSFVLFKKPLLDGVLLIIKEKIVLYSVFKLYICY